MSDRSHDRGFSLLELLVVLVLAAVMGLLAISAIRSTAGGANLRSGADYVISRLDLARQTATARNVPVEVRLYRDTGQLGNPYRIVGVVISGAVEEFVLPPGGLPGDVIMDEDVVYSTILDTGKLPVSPAPTGTEASTAPAMVAGRAFTRFIFLPSGGTNLADGSASSWTLTLVNVYGKKGGSGPAANFITLTVDPVSGRVRAFQP